MESNIIHAEKTKQLETFITPEAMLAHWQGHRKLTRRMIAVFPEDKLFTYAIGGMRPFSELAMEMIRMAAPGIKGVVIRKWPVWDELEKEYETPQTRDELLELWDKATAEINLYWPRISTSRFREEDTVFNQYKGTIYWSVLYFIDNEIHHRGQGYVYLRSLGIEPPPFWDRD